MRRSHYCFLVTLITMPIRSSLTSRLLIILVAGLALFCLPIQNTSQAEKEAPKQTADAKDAEKTQESPKGTKPAKPSIKSLGENRYQLGQITFNGKTREIRFPATMNLEKGLLEYAIVTGDGKIHESLLSTEISPSQLQIVMKLCRYRDGVGDTFDALFPDDEKKGEAGKAVRGSSIRIAMEWMEKVDGIEKMHRHQMDELLRDLKVDGPIPDKQWIYTGSLIYEGTFIAEEEGTLIAVYIDNGSLINSFRPGTDDDERWVTNEKVAPKIGTPITVILSPNTPEFPTRK